jgi:hypothetical protein
MGFRFQKRVKIIPGLRLNISRRNVGLSAGVKGARLSVNTSGRVTRSVGIPGTGIYNVKSTSLHGGQGNRSAVSAADSPVPVSPAPRPGILSPKWVRELYKVLILAPDLTQLPRVGAEYEQARPVAALLEAVSVAIPAGDTDRAITLLTPLYTSGYEPSNDAFLKKYAPNFVIDMVIGGSISVELRPDHDLIGLFLAESLQSKGDLPGTAEILEQLTPSTVTAICLADVYIDQKRWDPVVDRTNGITNDDEAATYLLIQRGIALREQGYPIAAREALKEALRVQPRPAELRHRALIERGVTYLAENKRA